jgi:hypothetical protein
MSTCRFPSQLTIVFGLASDACFHSHAPVARLSTNAQAPDRKAV